ncbi:MAG: TetR/AcrR family transcriptional regulator [Alphaproteobacteria bacterium]|nr:TetR/AcrR family transcriptional regulator [Alphaproteobacteria bacterium]
MRRTKEDAEQTRRMILASAMDIFYEKGYSKTTFDEIAKRINLTKGAVYWYFRNKPDIVAALINDYAERYMQLLQQFFEQNPQVSFSRLTKMQLFINKRIREDELFYKFLFFITCQMEWSEAIINKIQPSIEQTKQVTRKLFLDTLQTLQEQKQIKENVDTTLIAEILMTMYGGILDAAFTRRLSTEFDTAVETGFNLIFNSIKTEGAEL